MKKIIKCQCWKPEVKTENVENAHAPASKGIEQRSSTKNYCQILIGALFFNSPAFFWRYCMIIHFLAQKQASQCTLYFYTFAFMSYPAFFGYINVTPYSNNSDQRHVLNSGFIILLSVGVLVLDYYKLQHFLYIPHVKLQTLMTLPQHLSGKKNVLASSVSPVSCISFDSILIKNLLTVTEDTIHIVRPT